MRPGEMPQGELLKRPSGSPPVGLMSSRFALHDTVKRRCLAISGGYRNQRDCAMRRAPPVYYAIGFADAADTGSGMRAGLGRFLPSNAIKESIMAGNGRYAALLAGGLAGGLLAAVALSGSADAAAPRTQSGIDRQFIEVQGPGPGYGQEWSRREHCARLRERVRDIRYRMQSARPWERDRLGSRYHQLRERFRRDCGGYGRG